MALGGLFGKHCGVTQGPIVGIRPSIDIGANDSILEASVARTHPDEMSAYRAVANPHSDVDGPVAGHVQAAQVNASRLDAWNPDAVWQRHILRDGGNLPTQGHAANSGVFAVVDQPPKLLGLQSDNRINYESASRRKIACPTVQRASKQRAGRRRRGRRRPSHLDALRLRAQCQDQAQWVTRVHRDRLESGARDDPSGAESKPNVPSAAVVVEARNLPPACN